MKKNIVMQFKLMFSQKSLHYTLLILCLLSIITFIVNCISTFGRPLTDVPNAYFFFIGSTLGEGFYYIYSTILSLVCVIPFADSYFRDYNKNMLSVILLRTTPKTYYFSKSLAVFFSGFIVIFVSLMLNFFLNFITFPLSNGCDFTMFPTYYSDFYMKGYWSDLALLKNLFVQNPYLYSLLFLCITSVVSGIYAVIVYNISYFIKKQHILLLASMFILSNVLAILAGITGLNIRPENYCFAFSQFEVVKTSNIIAMVLFYLAFVFIPIPFCLKKLRNAI